MKVDEATHTDIKESDIDIVHRTNEEKDADVIVLFVSRKKRETFYKFKKNPASKIYKIVRH